MPEDRKGVLKPGSADDEDRTETSFRSRGAMPVRRALVYWPNDVAVKILPETGTITIGRGKDCGIPIDHRSVSRVHAALHLGASVEVEDLGSSNGTRLSGKLIEPHTREPLRAGTIIELGHATVIVQLTDMASASVLDPRLADTTAPPADGEQKSTIADQKSTMARIYELVDLVAPGRLSVLLLGETGVGKEVMAERLHARSRRADKPLLKLNCASLPEALLEGELFGYERGAFTGATQAKPGLIESAHGGTVLLDEAGELPLSTQVKLLRVLESREVQRIGSLTPRLVDVRFVAATNQDLETMIEAGTFRRDLYHRLNGIQISIPPLRERKREIPELARTFAREAADHMGWQGVVLTPQAMARLMDYPWPGNIRELRNTIERAVMLAAGGAVDVSHLALRESPSSSSMKSPAAGPVPAAAPTATVPSSPEEDDERQRIVDALEKCAGNQRKAAELLGISRRTLVTRLGEYNLPRPRKG
jgi:transcriptional regulator with GAF, ATPase, and Fis domain